MKTNSACAGRRRWSNGGGRWPAIPIWAGTICSPLWRAQLALDRFDQDRSIGRLLEQSGYGNHPAVIRFFNRMADALMEDSPAPGRPEHDLPPLEERMYAGWSSGN